ncbi:MAG: hypothetical protein GC137_02525 [Alphaproteobacteria bacterium]|nr:hypothetical protein [Alphaproteobacteria bacterium]
MNFLNKKSSTKATALHSALRYGSAVLAASVTLFAFSMNAASHEPLNSLERGYKAAVTDPSHDIQIPNSLKLPSTADNQCNALLNKSQPQPPRTTAVDNQRTAGKLVTISYLLGQRFALAPKINTKAKAEIERLAQADGNDSARSALAVAAYRDCQKQNALSRLALLRTR